VNFPTGIGHPGQGVDTDVELEYEENMWLRDIFLPGDIVPN